METIDTEVVIEARDLDTDERDRLELTVPAPGEAYQQRAQLVALVAEHHPEARLRSFANGAATFLGRQHLIVASYPRLPPPRSAKRSAPPAVPQASLFAP